MRYMSSEAADVGRPPMSEQATAWLDPAVDFVLTHGLAGLTLRPLAATLGTSDRMLIYHYGSKEQLVARIVERASERLGAAMLIRLTPPPPTVAAIVRRFWEALSAEQTIPYVRLYFELWVAAARQPPAYGDAVRRITTDWLGLVDQLYATTGETLQPGAALDTLATLDGLILADGALGPSTDTNGALERLAHRLVVEAGPRSRRARPTA